MSRLSTSDETNGSFGDAAVPPSSSWWHRAAHLYDSVKTSANAALQPNRLASAPSNKLSASDVSLSPPMSAPIMTRAPPVRPFVAADVSGIEFVEFAEFLRRQYEAHNRILTLNSAPQSPSSNASNDDVLIMSAPVSPSSSILSTVSVTAAPPLMPTQRYAQSAFIESIFILTGIVRCITHPVGGYVSANIFFPIAALAPPLRLSAMAVKMSALSALIGASEALTNQLSFYHDDTDKCASAVETFTAEVIPIQNELAFALTSVDEHIAPPQPHSANTTRNKSPNRKLSSPTETVTNDAAADGTDGAYIVSSENADEAHSLSNSFALAASFAADRLKTMTHRIAKQANRLQKALTADKVTSDSGDRYVTRICEFVQSLQPIVHVVFSHTTTDNTTDSERLLKAIDRVGVWLKSVVISFILDDMSAAVSRYSSAMMERFTLTTLNAQIEQDGSAYAQTTAVRAHETVTDDESASASGDSAAVRRDSSL